MITELGIVSGEIWHFLEKSKGKAGLDEIVKNVKKPKDVILMSVGWLAREGHVIIEGDSAHRAVSLRK